MWFFNFPTFFNWNKDVLGEKKSKNYQLGGGRGGVTIIRDSRVEQFEVFEYENIRSDLKCCHYYEKWKTMSDLIPGNTRDPRSIFR